MMHYVGAVPHSRYHGIQEVPTRSSINRAGGRLPSADLDDDGKASLSTSPSHDRPVWFTVSSGVASERGKRNTMEDKVIALEHPVFSSQTDLPVDDEAPRSFFAVYDGHGGDVCAEYCRRYLHMNMVRQNRFAQTDPELALKNAVVLTDGNFVESARRAHLEVTSGACAVIAYLYRDTLVIANVGGMLLFHVSSSMPRACWCACVCMWCVCVCQRYGIFCSRRCI